jgi:GTP-binding protein EngB required for normal cell division
MFKSAFGTEEITTERFLKALSQFQLMFISSGSKYDKVMRNEVLHSRMKNKMVMRYSNKNARLAILSHYSVMNPSEIQALRSEIRMIKEGLSSH